MPSPYLLAKPANRHPSQGNGVRQGATDVKLQNDALHHAGPSIAMHNAATSKSNSKGGDADPDDYFEAAGAAATMAVAAGAEPEVIFHSHHTRYDDHAGGEDRSRSQRLQSQSIPHPQYERLLARDAAAAAAAAGGRRSLASHDATTSTSALYDHTPLQPHGYQYVYAVPPQTYPRQQLPPQQYENSSRTSSSSSGNKQLPVRYAQYRHPSPAPVHPEYYYQQQQQQQRGNGGDSKEMLSTATPPPAFLRKHQTRRRGSDSNIQPQSKGKSHMRAMAMHNNTNKADTYIDHLLSLVPTLRRHHSYLDVGRSNSSPGSSSSDDTAVYNSAHQATSDTLQHLQTAAEQAQQRHRVVNGCHSDPSVQHRLPSESSSLLLSTAPVVVNGQGPTLEVCSSSSVAFLQLQHPLPLPVSANGSVSSSAPDVLQNYSRSNATNAHSAPASASFASEGHRLQSHDSAEPHATTPQPAPPHRRHHRASESVATPTYTRHRQYPSPGPPPPQQHQQQHQYSVKTGRFAHLQLDTDCDVAGPRDRRSSKPPDYSPEDQLDALFRYLYPLAMQQHQFSSGDFQQVDSMSEKLAVVVDIAKALGQQFAYQLYRLPDIAHYVCQAAVPASSSEAHRSQSTQCPTTLIVSPVSSSAQLAYDHSPSSTTEATLEKQLYDCIKKLEPEPMVSHKITNVLLSSLDAQAIQQLLTTHDRLLLMTVLAAFYITESHCWPPGSTACPADATLLANASAQAETSKQARTGSVPICRQQLPHSLSLLLFRHPPISEHGCPAKFQHPLVAEMLDFLVRKRCGFAISPAVQQDSPVPAPEPATTTGESSAQDQEDAPLPKSVALANEALQKAGFHVSIAPRHSASNSPVFCPRTNRRGSELAIPTDDSWGVHGRSKSSIELFRRSRSSSALTLFDNGSQTTTDAATPAMHSVPENSHDAARPSVRAVAPTDLVGKCVTHLLDNDVDTVLALLGYPSLFAQECSLFFETTTSSNTAALAYNTQLQRNLQAVDDLFQRASLRASALNLTLPPTATVPTATPGLPQTFTSASSLNAHGGPQLLQSSLDQFRGRLDQAGINASATFVASPSPSSFTDGEVQPEMTRLGTVEESAAAAPPPPRRRQPIVSRAEKPDDAPRQEQQQKRQRLAQQANREQTAAAATRRRSSVKKPLPTPPKVEQPEAVPAVALGLPRHILDQNMETLEVLQDKMQHFNNMLIRNQQNILDGQTSTIKQQALQQLEFLQELNEKHTEWQSAQLKRLTQVFETIVPQTSRFLEPLATAPVPAAAPAATVRRSTAVPAPVMPEAPVTYTQHVAPPVIAPMQPPLQPPTQPPLQPQVAPATQHIQVPTLSTFVAPELLAQRPDALPKFMRQDPQLIQQLASAQVRKTLGGAFDYESAMRAISEINQRRLSFMHDLSMGGSYGEPAQKDALSRSVLSPFADPEQLQRGESPGKMPAPTLKPPNKFYNVRLSQNPIFLRRTSIRPPYLKAIPSVPQPAPQPMTVTRIVRETSPLYIANAHTHSATNTDQMPAEPLVHKRDAGSNTASVPATSSLATQTSVPSHSSGTNTVQPEHAPPVFVERQSRSTQVKLLRHAQGVQTPAPLVRKRDAESSTAAPDNSSQAVQTSAPMAVSKRDAESNTAGGPTMSTAAIQTTPVRSAPRSSSGTNTVQAEEVRMPPRKSLSDKGVQHSAPKPPHAVVYPIPLPRPVAEQLPVPSPVLAKPKRDTSTQSVTHDHDDREENLLKWMQHEVMLRLLVDDQRAQRLQLFADHVVDQVINEAVLMQTQAVIYQLLSREKEQTEPHPPSPVPLPPPELPPVQEPEADTPLSIPSPPSSPGVSSSEQRARRELDAELNLPSLTSSGVDTPAEPAQSEFGTQYSIEPDTVDVGVQGTPPPQPAPLVVDAPSPEPMVTKPEQVHKSTSVPRLALTPSPPVLHDMSIQAEPAPDTPAPSVTTAPFRSPPPPTPASVTPRPTSVTPTPSPLPPPSSLSSHDKTESSGTLSTLLSDGEVLPDMYSEGEVVDPAHVAPLLPAPLPLDLDSDVTSAASETGLSLAQRKQRKKQAILDRLRKSLAPVPRSRDVSALPTTSDSASVGQISSLDASMGQLHTTVSLSDGQAVVPRVPLAALLRDHSEGEVGGIVDKPVQAPFEPFFDTTHITGRELEDAASISPVEAAPVSGSGSNNNNNNNNDTVLLDKMAPPADDQHAADETGVSFLTHHSGSGGAGGGGGGLSGGTSRTALPVFTQRISQNASDADDMDHRSLSILLEQELSEVKYEEPKTLLSAIGRLSGDSSGASHNTSGSVEDASSIVNSIDVAVPDGPAPLDEASVPATDDHVVQEAPSPGSSVLSVHSSVVSASAASTSTQSSVLLANVLEQDN
ncbi:hypothetical protein RI367_007868 [Sorochytrium milnesiophthora]